MKHSFLHATVLIAACAISMVARGQNSSESTAASATNNPTAAAPTVSAPVVASASAPSVDLGCKNPKATGLSRFWELEPASDCGTFGLRGYRPISLSVIGSDSVNLAPSSPTADHTATPLPYTNSETRMQLSVRTKVAQGLLTGGAPDRLDSLWFSYSQQSYWQLFNPTLSRPFRSTDHEPELTYIYPLQTAQFGTWRMRYAGVSANHQSNGQSLPLSRSWNRIIAKAGWEYGNDFAINANLWQRIPEDSAGDDNPEISDLVGRAEVAAVWNVNPLNTLSMTVRHSLAANTNGSVRLAWWYKLGTAGAAGERSGLRFHTELFSGYGDSLLDYNRKRTVLSVGLTLLDW